MGGSKFHRIHKIGSDTFRLVWSMDRYYASSRLRHPTNYQRIADEAGARRFANRWGIEWEWD